MERAVQGIQGEFLQELRASQRPVTVFLVNGIRLQGRIEFFDIYMVAVKSTVTQLVYKHAISTIAPMGDESARQEPNKRTDAKPNVVVRTKPSRAGWLKDK